MLEGVCALDLLVTVTAFASKIKKCACEQFLERVFVCTWKSVRYVLAFATKTKGKDHRRTNGRRSPGASDACLQLCRRSL